jgi:hypothetical protein
MEPMKPMAPMKPMEPMKPMQKQTPWWPADLGEPDGSGSQNGARYAYFGAKRRLVVDVGGSTRQYDTGDRNIHGFSQGGDGQGPAFATDGGPAKVDDFKLVD